MYCVAYENIVVLTRVDKNNDLKKSTKVKVLGHVKRSYTNASVSS